MASRHRARKSCIQIIRTAEISAKDCKRPATLQFHVSVVLFHSSRATVVVLLPASAYFLFSIFLLLPCV